MSGGMRITRADQAAYETGSVRFQHDFLNALGLLGLEDDTRCRLLGQCQSFFHGTQHDHHGTDWNAVPRDPGVGYLHERLQPQGFVPVNSVPHMSRKPDAPVPLARQVVSRFTEMLLGEGRRPSLRCWSSPETQEFLDAAFKAANLWDVLAQARDMAGSCGTSAIALGLKGGYIDAEILNPAHTWVAEWCEDSPGWCPKVVVTQARITKQVYETPHYGMASGLPPQDQAGETGQAKLTVKEYWQTRAWTEEYVIYYEDVPVDDVPEDGIPVLGYAEHGFGSCPVVWYQNTRNTDSPDGEPDCAGAWPLLDKLDRLQSQVLKASIANADPTLVLKQDKKNRRNQTFIQTGSGHVISLEPEGDAKYLEMTGSSVEVGLKAIDKVTWEVLQTVECVVIHPDTARAYQSGEALQILWRSMESRANRLRVTLADTIREICFLLISAAKHHGIANVEKVNTPEDRAGILLPPRRVMVETPQEPTPEEIQMEMPVLPPEPSMTFKVHEPGSPMTYVDFEWPPYWTPTAQQVGQMAQALGIATTQKQVLSAETASRQLAQMMGHDGDEEVRKLLAEDLAGKRAMMAGLGGIDELLADEVPVEDVPSAYTEYAAGLVGDEEGAAGKTGGEPSEGESSTTEATGELLATQG